MEINPLQTYEKVKKLKEALIEKTDDINEASELLELIKSVKNELAVSIKIVNSGDYIKSMRDMARTRVSLIENLLNTIQD